MAKVEPFAGVTIAQGGWTLLIGTMMALPPSVLPDQFEKLKVIRYSDGSRDTSGLASLYKRKADGKIFYEAYRNNIPHPFVGAAIETQKPKRYANVPH